MTKNQNTKRALLLSLFTMLLCMSMLIGSTYAWFTDTHTSSGNLVKSGKLDFTLAKWDGSNWVDATAGSIFKYELWEPGYTQVVNLKVENTGNLALKWEAAITSSGTLTILAENINVYVKVADSDTVKSYIESVDRFGFENEATIGNVKKYTLKDFIANFSNVAKGNLATTGAASYIGIVLQMPTSVDNTCQGLDLGGTFDITVVATQDAVESDGFGSDYDATAPLH